MELDLGAEKWKFLDLNGYIHFRVDGDEISKTYLILKAFRILGSHFVLDRLFSSYTEQYWVIFQSFKSISHHVEIIGDTILRFKHFYYKEYSFEFQFDILEVNVGSGVCKSMIHNQSAELVDKKTFNLLRGDIIPEIFESFRSGREKCRCHLCFRFGWLAGSSYEPSEFSKDQKIITEQTEKKCLNLTTIRIKPGERADVDYAFTNGMVCVESFPITTLGKNLVFCHVLLEKFHNLGFFHLGLQARDAFGVTYNEEQVMVGFDPRQFKQSLVANLENHDKLKSYYEANCRRIQRLYGEHFGRGLSKYRPSGGQFGEFSIHNLQILEHWVLYFHINESLHHKYY